MPCEVKSTALITRQMRSKRPSVRLSRFTWALAFKNLVEDTMIYLICMYACVCIYIQCTYTELRD